MKFFDYYLGKTVDVNRLLYPLQSEEEVKLHWEMFRESRKSLDNQPSTNKKEL